LPKTICNKVVLLLIFLGDQLLNTTSEIVLVPSSRGTN